MKENNTPMLLGMKKENVPVFLFMMICMGLCLALAGASAAVAGTDPTPAASPAAGSFWLWCTNNETTILASLLALSEVLARIPSIQANSIFELIVGALKIIANGKPNMPPKAQAGQ
ncbi:MAG: hypothetical protein P4L42_13425 [Desulfocapsaceae bacterium]|nr:hypothetical protein [Desulfocapsaceae bacterium]